MVFERTTKCARLVILYRNNFVLKEHILFTIVFDCKNETIKGKTNTLYWVNIKCFPNKIQKCKLTINKITEKIYYSNRLIFQFNGNNNVIIPNHILIYIYT